MLENELVNYPEVTVVRKEGKVHFVFPNASQGKEYHAILVRFSEEGKPILDNPIYQDFDITIEGLDKSGLSSFTDYEKKGIVIEGTPLINGTLDLFVKFTPKRGVSGIDIKDKFLCLKSEENLITLQDLRGSMIINPDPKLLWKNIPTPQDIEYYKFDEDFDFISTRNNLGKVIFKNYSLPSEYPTSAVGLSNNCENLSLSNDSDLQQKDKEDSINDCTTICKKSIEKNSIELTQNNPFLAGLESKSKLNIVVASKRGRSHAHEARPRDDDFAIDYIEESGWYISIVADGAGSAKYSRKGSQIACKTAKSIIREKLLNNKDLEHKILLSIEKFLNKENEAFISLKNDLRRELYKILPYAVIKAKESIKIESLNIENSSIRDYSTTIMISICKNINGFWFIAGFGVGDGGICVYKNKSISSLSVADSGEFAGQTRFITMNEIYSSYESLEARIKLTLVKDFKAIFLMTDGISDPKFETDANFVSPEKWNEFVTDISSEVDFSQDDLNLVSEQLMKWLDFWSPGNHDDRTIAVIY